MLSFQIDYRVSVAIVWYCKTYCPLVIDVVCVNEVVNFLIQLLDINYYFITNLSLYLILIKVVRAVQY